MEKTLPQAPGAMEVPAEIKGWVWGVGFCPRGVEGGWAESSAGSARRSSGHWPSLREGLMWLVSPAGQTGTCRGAPGPGADPEDGAEDGIVPATSPEGWTEGTRDGGAKWRDVSRTSRTDGGEGLGGRVWVGPECRVLLRHQHFSAWWPVSSAGASLCELLKGWDNGFSTCVPGPGVSQGLAHRGRPVFDE